MEGIVSRLCALQAPCLLHMSLSRTRMAGLPRWQWAVSWRVLPGPQLYTAMLTQPPRPLMSIAPRQNWSAISKSIHNLWNVSNNKNWQKNNKSTPEATELLISSTPEAIEVLISTISCLSIWTVGAWEK